jgi:4-hydroxy-4-methyl-2-oxoglutarate aldolase
MDATATTPPPVSAIADVLALWGLDGWLTPPLVPIVAPTSAVSGRALTIQLRHAPTGPGLGAIYDVLSGDLTGRVVVLAGARPVPGAVFGEILAFAAHGRGAAGALVDGAVRDQPEMAAIGLPVCAASTCVVGPNGTAHLDSVDETVTVGAAVLDPNDLVVIDPSGAVRIPADRAHDVCDAAIRYAAAETLVVDALAAGETLAEAYRYKRAVLAELRR